jgi:hypothetical protein
LHIGVPSIIPRHFFGMFTSRSALRDMPPRRESLVIGNRGPRQRFKFLKTLHVRRTLMRNQWRVANIWCRTYCIHSTEKQCLNPSIITEPIFMKICTPLSGVTYCLWDIKDLNYALHHSRYYFKKLRTVTKKLFN